MSETKNFTDQEINEALNKDVALTEQISQLSAERKALRTSEIWNNVKKIRKNFERNQNYHSGKVFRNLKQLLGVTTPEELEAKVLQLHSKKLAK